MLSLIKNTYNILKLLKGITIHNDKDTLTINVNKNLALKIKGHIVILNPEGHTVIDSDYIHLNPSKRDTPSSDTDKIQTKKIAGQNIKWYAVPEFN